MEEGNSLIEKLVAVILFRLNLITCDKLINYEKDIDPLLAQTLMNLPDLSAKSMSFRKAFMGEYNREAAYIVRLIDSPQGLLDYRINKEDVQKANPPFIKAIQILNHTFDVFQRAGDLSEKPSNQFYKEFNKDFDFRLNWLEYVNDPIGAILNKNQAGLAYKSYLVMAQDNQMLLHLLKAAVAINQSHLSPEAIPQFLESNKDKWGNDYTGMSLNWNAETYELSFDGPLQEDKAAERKLKIR
jgi:hypothetical protein